MYNTWEQVRCKGDMKLGRDNERWGRRKGKGRENNTWGNREKAKGDMNNWEGGWKRSRRKPKPLTQ